MIFHVISLLCTVYFSAASSINILTRQSNDGAGTWQEVMENDSDKRGVILVPDSTPGSASPPVSPDFIGFAFEEASFPRYVQTRDGNTNQYSLNLIDAIMSRTGGKPIVRLGGTSADYGRFIPSQQEPALPPAEVYNYQVSALRGESV